MCDNVIGIYAHVSIKGVHSRAQPTSDQNVYKVEGATLVHLQGVTAFFTGDVVALLGIELVGTVDCRRGGGRTGGSSSSCRGGGCTGGSSSSRSCQNAVAKDS